MQSLLTTFSVVFGTEDLNLIEP